MKPLYAAVLALGVATLAPRAARAQSLACCTNWLETGMAVCVAQDSPCVGAGQVSISIDQAGATAPTCTTGQAPCLVWALDRCCQADCAMQEPLCGQTMQPVPTCCQGYCGTGMEPCTPDASPLACVPFDPNCANVGAPPLQGCCTETDIALANLPAGTSHEWTVGFYDVIGMSVVDGGQDAATNHAASSGGGHSGCSTAGDVGQGGRWGAFATALGALVVAFRRRARTRRPLT
jgi:hypothetical protein